MTRRIWPLALAAVLGCILLLALGTWQVQRLWWKQQLLAEISRRAAAEPVSLDASLKLEPDRLDYLKVAAEGSYSPKVEFRVLTGFEGRPGWHLVRPFVSRDGIAVLVDRGVVPEDLPETARRPVPGGPTHIAGVVVRHVSAPNLFTPANDPASKTWYGWDVPTMLAAADFPADLRIAPFIVHAQEGGSGYPQPLVVAANLRNNHLGYAITWYGLALVLAVMAGVFIRQQPRRG